MIRMRLGAVSEVDKRQIEAETELAKTKREMNKLVNDWKMGTGPGIQ